MRRRVLALAGFAAGALAYRRWLGRDGERIDVYFDDGSFVTFAPESPDGGRLIPLAHQVLVAARRA
jgi:hypothetical protein